MDNASNITYTAHYESPLGGITLASSDNALVGLWFDGQKHFGSTLPKDPECIISEEVLLKQELLQPDTPKRNGAEAADALEVFALTRQWLDRYFSGITPSFTPPLQLNGTPFRQMVYEELLRIPYGHTTTYGQIAQSIAARRGQQSMSAQAVGNAVGHNPISLIVPCHRVLGSKGQLTGYAGGIERKEALLNLEQSTR